MHFNYFDDPLNSKAPHVNSIKGTKTNIIINVYSLLILLMKKKVEDQFRGPQSCDQYLSINCCHNQNIKIKTKLLRKLYESDI